MSRSPQGTLKAGASGKVRVIQWDRYFDTVVVEAVVMGTTEVAELQSSA